MNADGTVFFSVEHFSVAIWTLLVAVLCVWVHYEGLNAISRVARKIVIRRRRRVLVAIVLIVCLHVVEIWIFGISYFLMLKLPQFGTLLADHGMAIGDYVYFSATVFSTLGFGDIVPDGPVRFAVGVEALLGLVLITWSASFSFLLMERNWKPE